MMRAILALVLWASLAGAEGVPKLHFDQTVYDFGKSTEGDSLGGKFTFRNDGDAVLKIGTLDPSCGCTDARVTPDTLQPGETGEITFTLDLTNARGAVEKVIAVPSNDPDQPKAKLTIKGEVKAVFEFDPAMVLFDDLTFGGTGREVIEVKRLDGKKLLIGKAETTHELLSTSIEPVTNTPGDEARIVVRAKAGDKAEQFTDILSVYMTNALKPAFLIPIAGRVVSLVHVEPPALTWDIFNPQSWPGDDPDRNTLRRLIITATRPDRPLIIGDFASTFDGLLAKVVELEKEKKFEVVVKMTDLPLRSNRGILTFETNLPEQRIITIPVSINLSQP